MYFDIHDGGFLGGGFCRDLLTNISIAFFGNDCMPCGGELGKKTHASVYHRMQCASFIQDADVYGLLLTCLVDDSSYG